MDQNDIDRLIQQYLAAWNESNADLRHNHLEKCWGDNGIYTDPMTHAADRDALDAVIAGFRGQAAGANFSLAGPVDHHHNHIRFFWQLTLLNGQTMKGMDYGEIGPDGRLAKIVGFF